MNDSGIKKEDSRYFRLNTSFFANLSFLAFSVVFGFILIQESETYVVLIFLIFAIACSTHSFSQIRKQRRQSLKYQNSASVADQEVKTSHHRVRKSEVARDYFTREVVHELRSPMQTILMAADMVEIVSLNGADLSKLNYSVQKIRDSVDMVNRQLQDLHEFTSGRDPQISIIKSSVNLVDFVERTLAGFASEANRKGLRFTAEIDPSCNLLTINTDALRLQQVFINLLDNAIKYTPQGSIDVAVSVTHETLHIQVTDTGIGILEDDREKILTPFERGSNVQDSMLGSGMGLAIVSRIVQKLNGHLTFQKTEKGGTLVKVDLPFGHA